MSTGRGVRLLDIAPQLGAELDENEFAEAVRRVVIPAFVLDEGRVDVGLLRDAEPVVGQARAAIVVEGLLTLELELAGRVCARLVGPGETILLDGRDGGSIPTEVKWFAAGGTRLGVLDARVMAAGQRWPALIDALLAHVAQQEEETFKLQAINQLPRVEDRLLAHFWLLADRYGQMRADGAFIGLRVGHERLGQMIGARRPTVSLALKSLTSGGLVRQQSGGWVLSHESKHALSHEADTADDRRRASAIASIRPAQPAASPLRVLSAAGRPRVLLLATDAVLGESAAFEIVRAHDEVAALAALENQTVDLVVVDAREPQLRDLPHLVMRLRTQPPARHARLLVLGDEKSPSQSTALLAAAHEYIAQAFELEALHGRIIAQLALTAARARALANSGEPPGEQSAG